MPDDERIVKYFAQMLARVALEAEGEVRISIEPPLDNREAMTFDEVSHPMRWRRA
jgi:hypothetical protein